MACGNITSSKEEVVMRNVFCDALLNN